MFRHLLLVISLATTLGGGLLAQTNAAGETNPLHRHAVTYWNAIAIDALGTEEGTNPMAHSRILAILHASVHDALNAIDPRFESYTPGLAATPGASAAAAIAAASRDVLVALFPTQAGFVEEAYSRALASIPQGTAKTAGIRLGQAAALANMTRRQGDSSATATQPVYVPLNPLTQPDTSWQPFLITPPVPDYPSTHTVLGWAAAEVLIDVLGDRVRYRATSLTLPGVTREYRGFSRAAQENGLSRLYAGIHFVHAVKEGRRQGRSIGRAVAEALPPVSD